MFISDQPFYYISGWCSRKSIHLGQSSSLDAVHIHFGRFSSWGDVHIELGWFSSWDDDHIQLGRCTIQCTVHLVYCTSSDDVHVKQMYTLALLPLQRMFPQNIACEIRHLQAWPFFHACPFHQSVGHIIIMLLLDWWLIAQLLVFLTSVALLST